MAKNFPYTHDEQKAIVDYIVKNDCFSIIKGDRLWRDMEEAEVTSRTWQSLKQHFRKTIIMQLHYPRYGLSPENIAKFKEHFHKIDTKRKNTSRKNARKPTRFRCSLSSSDDDRSTPRKRHELNGSSSSTSSTSSLNLSQASTSAPHVNDGASTSATNIGHPSNNNGETSMSALNMENQAPTDDQELIASILEDSPNIDKHLNDNDKESAVNDQISIVEDEEDATVDLWLQDASNVNQVDNEINFSKSILKMQVLIPEVIDLCSPNDTPAKEDPITSLPETSQTSGKNSRPSSVKKNFLDMFLGTSSDSGEDVNTAQSANNVIVVEDDDHDSDCMLVL